MINCKRHIIAACLTLMLPLTGWSEAPVVDDSDNFAMMDEQQAYDAPVAANPKYNDQYIENAEMDKGPNDKYAGSNGEDTGPALVKEESNPEPRSQFNKDASLIDKVQNLQKEVQELRGQLEVQAHDLKLLQQQQVAFYKDLDARLSSGSAPKAALNKPSTDITVGAKAPTTVATAPAAVVNTVKPATTTTPKPVVTPVSRINPADEQISYLAAYELVKNKRYDDALVAMQTFTQKYPKGGYTANAEYWLGELYLVKKDYTQAINHFEYVLKEFPSSSKSAASMLKAGYAYAASGDKQTAKVRFQQVVSTYPGTPTAKLAHTKLESI